VVVPWPLVDDALLVAEVAVAALLDDAPLVPLPEPLVIEMVPLVPQPTSDSIAAQLSSPAPTPVRARSLTGSPHLTPIAHPSPSAVAKSAGRLAHFGEILRV
jgi:hypothetical protein